MARKKKNADFVAWVEDIRPVDAPEVDAPEVDAPEVDAPEVDAPEVDAPDIVIVDAPSPDTLSLGDSAENYGFNYVGSVKSKDAAIKKLQDMGDSKEQKTYRNFWMQRYMAGAIARFGDFPSITDDHREYAEFIFNAGGFGTNKVPARTKDQEDVYGLARQAWSRILKAAGVDSASGSGGNSNAKRNEPKDDKPAELVSAKDAGKSLVWTEEETLEHFQRQLTSLRKQAIERCPTYGMQFIEALMRRTVTEFISARKEWEELRDATIAEQEDRTADNDGLTAEAA